MRSHLMEAALLFISMLFYKNALGHSDWIHVAYVLPAPTILFLFIAVRHIFVPMLRNIRVEEFAAGEDGVCCPVLDCVRRPERVSSEQRFARRYFERDFSIGRGRQPLSPVRWKPIVAFLRENLSPGETFYTLSDELSIYYFVGRCARCVSRFRHRGEGLAVSERHYCGPPGSQCEICVRRHKECVFRTRWLLE